MEREPDGTVCDIQANCAVGGPFFGGASTPKLGYAPLLNVHTCHGLHCFFPPRLQEVLLKSLEPAGNPVICINFSST